jgi:death on curing protein
VIYLRYAELLRIAERVLGAPPLIRDAGLLEAALARPQTSVFGEDAYPSLVEKAAALTHSIARNHALVDGNKRLALAGLIAFLGMNGHRLSFSNDEAYDFIIDIATGAMSEVAAISERLQAAMQPRS